MPLWNQVSEGLSHNAPQATAEMWQSVATQPRQTPNKLSTFSCLVLAPVCPLKLGSCTRPQSTRALSFAAWGLQLEGGTRIVPTGWVVPSEKRHAFLLSPPNSGAAYDSDGLLSTTGTTRH